jgi:hypothetical protein
MAASEIEIFNSKNKRIGAVSVRADTTAADFWEQVPSNCAPAPDCTASDCTAVL